MAAGRSNPRYSRGRLIWLFALPLIPGAFATLENGAPGRAGLYAAALLGFVMASLCIRRGLAVQRRRAASRFTTVRTHRLTWYGAVLLAATVFLTQTVLGGQSLAVGATLGLLGFAGAYLYYGALPRRRVTQGAHGYTAEEIAELLGKGERDVNAIERVARRVDDRDLRLRLLRVVVKSHRILNEVHEDPADLRRARRFFSVFLPGMRDVCESYLRAGNDGEKTKDVDTRFADILRRMEHLVDSQYKSLHSADALDHDVKSEVLQTQIDAAWGRRKAG